MREDGEKYSRSAEGRRGGLEKVVERKQERLRPEKHNRRKEEEAMTADTGMYN